jgi:hypothetical protein
MYQYAAWSYYSADADAPSYACAPLCLCSSLAQDPCSPSLRSSQSLEPPEHRSVHHSSHSRNIPTSHRCQLGDILVHRHGPLFQILKLLLQLDNSLGNMRCAESSSEFRPIDALGFLMGFHVSIPLVGCRTRKLVRG